MNWCGWERIGSHWGKLLWAETEIECWEKLEGFPAATTVLPVERVVLREGETPWHIREPIP